MAVNDMNELLRHELADIYFAEKHILKALKKMEKEVSNPVIHERLVLHQEETEEQITVLERVFAAIGEKAKAQKCPGILGIIEEHDEFKKEEEPSKQLLELFDLGSGLRVEHYEIAAYRTAIALAKALGEREASELLGRNLAQEVDMERFLVANAPAALRGAAASTNGAMMEQSGARRNGRGNARKRSSTKRAASKRGRVARTSRDA